MAATYFQRGDRVRLDKPWADSTPFGHQTMVVTGFAPRIIGRLPAEPHPPGLYVDYNRVFLATDDMQLPGFQFYSRLVHDDPKVAESRSPRPKRGRQVRIRKLPLGTFCEGDIVEVIGRKGKVYIADTDHMAAFGNPSETTGLYTISETLGATHGVYGACDLYSARQLKLIEHGNVWRILTRQSPVFDDDKEMVRFYLLRGEFTVIARRNNEGEARKVTDETGVDGWFRLGGDWPKWIVVHMNNRAIGKVLHRVIAEGAVISID